ncbi:hypothetical protein BD560DRAFT_341386, partial [Blakeslea trispora]
MFFDSHLRAQLHNPQIHHMPPYWTDHSLLTVDLFLGGPPCGPGAWRFNPTLLTDKHFCQLLDQTVIAFL